MAGPADMKDDAQTIDPRVFIKELAPDQLGQFEPLSGLMLLNISKGELVELSQRWGANNPTEFDIAILRTINHEAYHFAQAAASGYVFHRQCRLFRVLNSSEPMPEAAPDPEVQTILDAAREAAGVDPALKLRYEQLMAMLKGHEMFAQFEAQAADGDHSLAGALLPGFFTHLKWLAEQESVRNADGLSILGILEGSAVVHANLLMHPNDDATPHITAELETLSPVYRELYDLTLAKAGDRALELLLPTVTLACRYAQPHNAYAPLLDRLTESAPNEAFERGRILSNQLPEIADAGPIFGTALDLRRQSDDYRIYDPVLEQLASGQWDIDSYDFLAQPSAMHKVGSFPMGIVTTDGYLGALPQIEIAARMALMSAVLRSQSRRRAEREFRQFQASWAHNVIARLMGGDPPPATP